ncbi:hypothetical protein [Actinacidiphila oryziradicis]|uniref:Uncharacterized protein n=1 Tax=Actinacidiphila oryziradicis TaxID=2571141 RepID=A0A4U0RHI7_9ACTN|nr:hypothetical protein [Actinacidiphila oryziradicis]TJZ94586.1 hypothetical protein FCI23_53390 [Actinacidiphila oryziradicis]
MTEPFVPGQLPPDRKAAGGGTPAVELLKGRVLLHENARFVPHTRPLIDEDLGGVIVTGAGAEERAFQLRHQAGYNGVLLIDSAAYTGLRI